jgi:hypothetical protein
MVVDEGIQLVGEKNIFLAYHSLKLRKNQEL